MVGDPTCWEGRFWQHASDSQTKRTFKGLLTRGNRAGRKITRDESAIPEDIQHFVDAWPVESILRTLVVFLASGIGSISLFVISTIVRCSGVSSPARSPDATTLNVADFAGGAARIRLRTPTSAAKYPERQSRASSPSEMDRFYLDHTSVTAKLPASSCTGPHLSPFRATIAILWASDCDQSESKVYQEREAIPGVKLAHEDNFSFEFRLRGGSSQFLIAVVCLIRITASANIGRRQMQDMERRYYYWLTIPSTTCMNCISHQRSLPSLHCRNRFLLVILSSNLEMRSSNHLPYSDACSMVQEAAGPLGSGAGSHGTTYTGPLMMPTRLGMKKCSQEGQVFWTARK